MERKYPRWKVTVDGKWAGGSYATKAEASKAARLIRTSPNQKIVVEPKGTFMADTAPSSPPPATEPADEDDASDDTNQDN